jgi:hypothetical protein
MLQLYHNGVQLGGVNALGRDGPWMCGELSLLPGADLYREFFEFMTDETKGDREPPFSSDLLDPQNWFVQDELNQVRGIEVPAVHADGLIQWRWR